MLARVRDTPVQIGRQVFFYPSFSSFWHTNELGALSLLLSRSKFTRSVLETVAGRVEKMQTTTWEFSFFFSDIVVPSVIHSFRCIFILMPFSMTFIFFC